MKTKFNINRPKVNDEELEKRKNFDDLVNKFKEQSLADAKAKQRSGINLKKMIYTSVILGITIICTITLSQLQNKK